MACIILFSACSDNEGSSGKEDDYTAHKQAKIQTSLEKKDLLAFAGLQPARDAKNLAAHYDDQAKSEIPHDEVQGGDPERTVPLGDVLLEDGKDTTSGPLKDNRLVAFYGTPLSEDMGILGEYSPEEMMEKLKEKTQEYSNLDPERPAIPTIELIATIAQRSPGPEGLYIAPPDDDVIQEYVELADDEDALLLLDVQLGRASVMEAVKEVEPYLKDPNVHLAIDTEYSVGEGQVPGEDLGHVNGAEVQEAIDYVDDMVQEENLPDKMVLVHQFGNGIIQNKGAIHPTDHVEVPLNYDGFGKSAIKVGAYGKLVRDESIQYGGFKLFTENDDPMMTPQEVLQLEPSPVIVNYQ